MNTELLKLRQTDPMAYMQELLKKEKEWSEHLEKRLASQSRELSRKTNALNHIENAVHYGLYGG